LHGQRGGSRGRGEDLRLRASCARMFEEKHISLLLLPPSLFFLAADLHSRWVGLPHSPSPPLSLSPCLSVSLSLCLAFSHPLRFFSHRAVCVLSPLSPRPPSPSPAPLVPFRSQRGGVKGNSTPNPAASCCVRPPPPAPYARSSPRRRNCAARPTARKSRRKRSASVGRFSPPSLPCPLIPRAFLGDREAIAVPAI